MAVIQALATRSDWGGLQGGSGVQSRLADSFSVLPPDARWDRSIRMELRDGDIAPWQSDAEVAQAQRTNTDGGVRIYPFNTVRWTEFWIRIDQVGSDYAWNFYTETHLPSGGTQAPWAMHVNGGTQKLRHWIGPGSWTVRDGGASSIDLGNWHHIRIGQYITNTTAGWYELYYDNTRVYRFDGITNQNTDYQYPKIGWYRSITSSGTEIAYIAGFQVHDTNPGYPGSGPPAPTTSVSITTPAEGSSHTGTLSWAATLASQPSGYTLYVGLGGASQNIYVAETAVNATGDNHSGTLDLSGIDPAGETVSLYAALHNSSGGLAASDGVNVTVAPSDPGQVGQDFSVRIDGTGAVSADFQFSSVVAVSRVASVGFEEVTYRRPKLVEIMDDGSYGAEVVWNSANSRFEYKDQQT